MLAVALLEEQTLLNVTEYFNNWKKGFVIQNHNEFKV